METRSHPRSRRWRTALLGVVGVVALWGVVGGLLLPPLARHLIAKDAGEQLGREVVLDRVSVNPYTLEATVEGLRILEPDRITPFVSFERLDVDASAASFYRFAPIVDRLTLTGLKVNLVRDAQNHYNLSDIVARLQAAARASAAKAKGRPEEEPARFSISNIRLVNAAVDFDDRPVGRKHRLSEVHLSVPFVSSLPRHLKEYIQPSFAANVNGAPLLITGETMPFEDTLRTHFTLDVSAVDVRRYLEYAPVPLPVKVESGTLDAHLTVRFTQATGKAPAIDVAGTAGLRDVAVANAEGPMAKFARLEVDVASLDPIAGRLRVSAVRLQDAAALGQVQVSRLEATGIDLDQAKRTAHVEAVATSGGQVDVKRASDGSMQMPRLAPDSPAGAAAAAEPADAPAWKFALDRLSLSGYQVTLADAAVKPALTHRLALQSVEATEVSNDQGVTGKAVARLALDHGGSLEADAAFALEPLQVTAKLDARNVDLVPLRRYMTEFPMVQLKSGAASARGTLAVKGKPGALQVAYNGVAEVARFSTFDTSSSEDLLNFRSVRAGGVDFSWAADAPLTLTVAEIVVDRAYSRMVLNPDGKLNVQQLRTGSADAPAAGAAEPEPRPRNVRIGRITFVDGRLNFTDHYIRPNYSADVGELQGAVTGLSSEPASRAEVDLKGRYDATSPVTIAGTVNPLRGDLFLDIAAKGKDIELPKLTAYSQRYAGYGIKEGRLSLDVKYHIENGKLEGRNNILIERLTFGDKVESPDATTLPVLFAVNLLKDDKGEIALELPITGSLSDPQFAISGLITQVLGNLLKKAVTSPFSLLAAAFGGPGAAGGPAAASGPGDAARDGAAADLAYVDFAAGLAELDAADRRKLETMARALKGRPGLTLALAPHADAEADLRALRFAALQRAVAGDGKAVDDAAYPAAVRAAYARAKLPGDPQQLSVATMETGLMERLPVGDAEVRALSQRRIDGVRAYLVDKGQLPAERMVMAQAAGEGAAADAGRGSRVDFSLR
jgi:uncharacterized protein involved in outer membrane biogenesis